MMSASWRPVGHVALVADGHEEAACRRGAGEAGQPGAPPDPMASRLGSPARHRRWRSNSSGQDLAGLVAVDEADVEVRGGAPERPSVRLSIVSSAARGGVAEPEAAVDDRLGREQPGEGLASRPGVRRACRAISWRSRPRRRWVGWTPTALTPAKGRTGAACAGRGREGQVQADDARRWPRSVRGPRPPRPDRSRRLPPHRSSWCRCARHRRTRGRGTAPAPTGTKAISSPGRSWRTSTSMTPV